MIHIAYISGEHLLPQDHLKDALYVQNILNTS